MGMRKYVNAALPLIQNWVSNFLSHSQISLFSSQISYTEVGMRTLYSFVFSFQFHSAFRLYSFLLLDYCHLYSYVVNTLRLVWELYIHLYSQILSFQFSAFSFACIRFQIVFIWITTVYSLLSDCIHLEIMFVRCLVQYCFQLNMLSIIFVTCLNWKHDSNWAWIERIIWGYLDA